MERLGDMGIISTHSVAADGLDSEAGEKCWIGGYAEGQTRHHPHPSAASTKGIMKKPTACPEIQKRASRQTMNPKMVDPKPSVRFTLDLPPTLDLDLSSSGSGLDIGRKTIQKEVHTMPSLGSWAERTAAALLNKSRDVAHVDAPPTLIAIESATVLCPIKSGISAAEPHVDPSDRQRQTAAILNVTEHATVRSNFDNRQEAGLTSEVKSDVETGPRRDQGLQDNDGSDSCVSAQGHAAQ